MRLTVADKLVCDNPNSGEIAKALKLLDAKDSSFAVLSKSEMVYIQVSGSTSSGFSLEYRGGSAKEHYCCLNDLTLDDIITAFQSYAVGENWQQARWTWEQLNKFVGQRHHAKTKTKLPVWNIWNICYCLFAAICIFAVLFGKQKGANLNLWLRIFFSSIALCFAVATTQDLMAGSSQLQFGKITRSESPFQFWSGIIAGYTVSIVVLVIVLLSAFGAFR